MKKKFLSQLISLLVVSTAAQALLATHSFAAPEEMIIDNGTNINVQIADPYDRVHVTSTGAITDSTGLTPALTVNSGVTVNTFLNDGSITGYRGINNMGTIDTIINNGEINGSQDGITNYGILGTITNNGQIISNGNGNGIYSASDPIFISNTSIGTITNNGYIYGGFAGINNSQSQAIHIVNNGTLSGGSFALFVSTDVTLTNNNLVMGDIRSLSTEPLIINGGTNTTGTLTGNNHLIVMNVINDINDINDINSIGTITSLHSSVVFGTGSLLLNDHVNSVNVLNKAASLQVNNPINIMGNYHQNAAATLISGVSDLATSNGNIDTDTGYGRLKVSGNATIDAGSHVNLRRTGSTYKFAEGQRYVVIKAAAAGTEYNADKLNYKAIGYNGVVKGSVYVYEDTTSTSKALVLTVGPEQVSTDPVVTEPTPTQTTKPTPTQPAPNQTTKPTQPTQSIKRGWATIPSATAALGGLANYSGIASPQLLELYNASLAIEGKEEANRAGERLSPGQNINASSAATVATSTAQAVVGAHIDAVRSPQTSAISGVATGDDYSSNWIVWGQPFGGYARQDSTDEVSGYTAKFGGLIIGADRSLGDDWRLGAAVNYSNTSVHGKDNLSGNTSAADSYGVIGYAGYTGDPWYLNLSAGVNRQNYSSVRRADFTGFSGAAQGKFNGQSITLQTEFGYPLILPTNAVLTPLASLTYGYQHVDGYQETGGNGMALDVSNTHSQSVVSELGSRIEKTFSTSLGNLTPFAQVSWIHQYDNRQVSSRASYAADTVGETSFITKGASPVEDMAGLAIGSTLYEANELSFDARYDLQAGDRYQAHTFSLRLRKSF